MQNLYQLESFHKIFAQKLIQCLCLIHMLKGTNLLYLQDSHSQDGPKVTNRSHFSIFCDKLFRFN